MAPKPKNAPEQNVLRFVTPVWAANVLKNHNKHNRALRDKDVKEIAALIRAGRFPTTAQGLAFDVDGDLLDGQHRLAGIVLANQGIWLYVATGCPKEYEVNGVMVPAWAYYDAGKARTNSQLLAKDGVKNAKGVSAVVRSLANWVVGTDGWVSLSMAKMETIRYLLPESVNEIVSIGVSGKINRPQAAILAPIVFYHTVRPKAALEFINKICNMNGVPEGDSTYALASWNMKHPGQLSRGRYANTGCRVCASAIMHFDKGVPVYKLHDAVEHSTWLKLLNWELCQAIQLAYDGQPKPKPLLRLARKFLNRA